MENIDAGDTVRHKILIHLNGGVAFNVLDVEEDRAFCDYFDENNVNQQEWFNVSDLILVNKAKGGFSIRSSFGVNFHQHGIAQQVAIKTLVGVISSSRILLLY